jgi:hypothetical protein
MRRYPALSVAILATTLAGGAGSAVLGVCGPFTDVSDAAFCPFVLEIFTLGITTGTTPTTYDPGSSVTRLQMAAFLSRSVDGVLQRGSPRALVKKFWTPKNSQVLALTSLGSGACLLAESDGRDVWVAKASENAVWRIRGSDGRLAEVFGPAEDAFGVLVAMGRVFATGGTTPGRLYRIDPAQGMGAVATVASNLGGDPRGIAFDGSRVWTVNNSSVSIVTPGASLPWTATTVTTGFFFPKGAVFDGANIWVTDNTGTLAEKLLKLDANGAVLQTVTVGVSPDFPVFDGANIWVPNNDSNSVSVVRASTGAVLSTLTGNGLDSPFAAAFDGQRVLVTNNGGNSVSLWKAADLTPIGFVPTGAASFPTGACSDGINFWIVLNGTSQLARF